MIAKMSFSNFLPLFLAVGFAVPALADGGTCTISSGGWSGYVHLKIGNSWVPDEYYTKCYDAEQRLEVLNTLGTCTVDWKQAKQDFSQLGGFGCEGPLELNARLDLMVSLAAQK